MKRSKADNFKFAKRISQIQNNKKYLEKKWTNFKGAYHIFDNEQIKKHRGKLKTKDF